MLDGKILAAVLATLTAVAAGTGGSSFDTQDAIPEVPETPELPDLGPIDRLTEFLNTVPEPERDLKAELEVTSIEDDVIKFKGATIRASDLYSVNADKKRIMSEKPLTLKGFKGKFNPGRNTSLQGTISGVLTEGVNITGSMRVNVEMGSERIDVSDIGKTPLSLEGAKGSVSSGDAFTRFREGSRGLEVNSFSGNMTVYPENRTIYLNGKVDKLSYGNFSYGS